VVWIFLKKRVTCKTVVFGGTVTGLLSTNTSMPGVTALAIEAGLVSKYVKVNLLIRVARMWVSCSITVQLLGDDSILKELFGAVRKEALHSVCICCPIFKIVYSKFFTGD
jgi:hypothetical protein